MKPRTIVVYLLIALAAFMLTLALFAAVEDGDAHTGTARSLSCDGKPVGFHVDRAMKLADKAYSPERILDPTPEAGEKAKWQKHKRCVRNAKLRKRIANHVDDVKANFAATFTRYITPPGAGWLASLRACESGSSGLYSTDTGNGFQGAYQFTASTWTSTGPAYEDLTGLPANPSRLAAPREQDIRAAILFRREGGGPWPNCP